MDIHDVKNGLESKVAKKLLDKGLKVYDWVIEKKRLYNDINVLLNNVIRLFGIKERRNCILLFGFLGMNTGFAVALLISTLSRLFIDILVYILSYFTIMAVSSSTLYGIYYLCTTGSFGILGLDVDLKDETDTPNTEGSEDFDSDEVGKPNPKDEINDKGVIGDMPLFPNIKTMVDGTNIFYPKMTSKDVFKTKLKKVLEKKAEKECVQKKTDKKPDSKKETVPPITVVPTEDADPPSTGSTGTYDIGHSVPSSEDKVENIVAEARDVKNKNEKFVEKVDMITAKPVPSSAVPTVPVTSDSKHMVVKTKDYIMTKTDKMIKYASPEYKLNVIISRHSMSISVNSGYVLHFYIDDMIGFESIYSDKNRASLKYMNSHFDEKQKLIINKIFSDATLRYDFP